MIKMNRNLLLIMLVAFGAIMGIIFLRLLSSHIRERTKEPLFDEKRYNELSTLLSNIYAEIEPEPTRVMTKEMRRDMQIKDIMEWITPRLSLQLEIHFDEVQRLFPTIKNDEFYPIVRQISDSSDDVHYYTDRYPCTKWNEKVSVELILIVRNDAIVCNCVRIDTYEGSVQWVLNELIDVLIDRDIDDNWKSTYTPAIGIQGWVVALREGENHVDSFCLLLPQHDDPGALFGIYSIKAINVESLSQMGPWRATRNKEGQDCSLKEILDRLGVDTDRD